MRLPVLHVDRLLSSDTTDEDGLTLDELYSLLSDLTASDVRTPSAAALWAGLLPIFTLERPFLPALGHATGEDLAAWMTATSAQGAASFWFVQTDSEQQLRTSVTERDIPLLAGHGVVPVLSGPGDEPLTNLSPAELRQKLTSAREAFTSRLGVQPRWIAPPSPVVGTATDELVRRELRSAGFRGILVPARPGGEHAASIDGCEPDQPIPFRTAGPSDDISSLKNWILGTWRGRSTSRLRQVADTPRRWADQLFGGS